MAAHFKTVLDGSNDSEKLHHLCTLTYKEQAVWFLNAFWEAGLPAGGGLSSKKEEVWGYVEKASTIDNAKATGNAMDEMEAHRFLEAVDEAHTVLQVRFFFFRLFCHLIFCSKYLFFLDEISTPKNWSVSRE